MARKIPVSDAVGLVKGLRNAALGAAKDPRGTSERVLGHAKGVAETGRQVAEGMVGQVTRQVRRRRGTDAPRAAAPAHRGPLAEPAAPRKAQGDPLVEPAAPALPTPTPADVAKKVAAKKPATKKPGTKTPATKTPASKTTAKKPVAKKPVAKKPAPAGEAAPTKNTAAAKKATPSAAGDKLPPRRAVKATPPPPPREVEPNPEAID